MHVVAGHIAVERRFAGAPIAEKSHEQGVVAEAAVASAAVVRLGFAGAFAIMLKM